MSAMNICAECEHKTPGFNECRNEDYRMPINPVTGTVNKGGDQYPTCYEFNHRGGCTGFAAIKGLAILVSKEAHDRHKAGLQRVRDFATGGRDTDCRDVAHLKAIASEALNVAGTCTGFERKGEAHQPRPETVTLRYVARQRDRYRETLEFIRDHGDCGSQMRARLALEEKT